MAGPLLMASGDPPVVLQLTEQAFDHMPLLVERPVTRALLDAVPLGGNDSLDGRFGPNDILGRRDRAAGARDKSE